MQAKSGEGQIYIALALAITAAVVSTAQTYDLSPPAGKTFLPAVSFEINAMAPGDEAIP